MEPVGSCAALECEEVIRLLRFIVQLIAGVASALPLLVYGHGGEFLEARLETQGGMVNLRIVAQYGDNPMIADEAEARQVLADALRIEVGTARTNHRLDELTPLVMAPRAARDPESPMPPSTDDHAHSDNLLEACWTWAATEEDVSFFVPETSRQVVLFWMPTPGEKSPRWSMLVPGDRTPAIFVKLPWWRTRWTTGAGVVLVLLVTITVHLYLRRRSSQTGKRPCGEGRGSSPV